LPAAAPGANPVDVLVDTLGGPGSIRTRFAAVLACTGPGGGAALRDLADRLSRGGFAGPVIDARRRLGAFAAVSAAASALGVELIRSGVLPAGFKGEREVPLEGRGILVASLGERTAAVEVLGPGSPT
jgi:hypothetical protein